MADRQIQLTERFILKYDTIGNIWLSKLRDKVSKDGKYRGETYCGYLGKFELLLQNFVLQAERDEEGATVEEYLTKMAAIEGRLLALAKSLGEELDKEFPKGVRACGKRK